MATARKLWYLQQAVRFQWLSEAEVRREQLRKLRSMITFCEERVPLYRDKFKQAGVSSRDLQTLDDLKLFPTVTREEVVGAYPDRLLYRKATPEDRVFRTSGTSGLFMEINYSARANDFLDAIYLRALLNAGYRPWSKIAYFWEEPKPPGIYERLGLMRKHMLPVDPDPYAQLANLRRIKPEVIYHFPSSMAMIARIVRSEGRGDLRPRSIICQGEFMPRETQDEIAQAFDCPVFNQYGAQEFNRIGWNCDRRDGMHIDADSVVVEIMDGDNVLGPGEDGEIVITGLENELMPMIRYRVGDAGRLRAGACSCGRGLPMFEVTEGRIDDIIDLPGGRRMGPRTLAPRVEQLEGFTQYRIVQKALDRFEMMIVRDRNAPSDIEDQAARRVREVLGTDISITVSSVPEIPLNRRGKLRKIVSELPSKRARQ
jgi:phenylacetate-CoA ligase